MCIKRMEEAEGRFFVAEMPKSASSMLKMIFLMVHQWRWDADELLRETCAEFERKHLGVQA